MRRWVVNIGRNVTEDDVQRTHNPQGDRELVVGDPKPVAGYDVGSLKGMGIRGVWEEVEGDAYENV